MKDALPGRELFAFEALGVIVQGTCHLPPEPSWQTRSGVGVLLLSGLLAPRAGVGDSLVYWADSFADCGYKSFRVDLPGTCDSGGDPPAELMNYINSGSYEATVVQIIKQLVKRYDLASVVIVGHCSGTVTALFAAAACVDCRGLVLLEPYFHLPPPAAAKTREALSDWAASNRFGGMLSNLFDWLKEVRLRLRRSELPGNANFPLLKRWKHLASAGLPILVLKVPSAKAVGAKPRLGEFDYLAHVVGLGGSSSRVEVKVIEGAGHSFADQAGRTTVRRCCATWLSEFFPQVAVAATLQQDHPAVPARHPVSTDALIPMQVSSGN